ncbi:hypothetical protein BaRGS_00027442 [Batillaria attramentaria]|uniref:Ammonium transporter AmtB-like domain-containing protein n=1 Tax=Batillaria attramentaria TaxID=370345 RepID=A0ABD0K2P1_9CAEN
MAAINRTTLTAGDDPDAANKGPITWDDATWILTSAFIIFTMQSGFGMLEAGAVHSKNTVNIMVKNVVDVVFGGMTYWMFGFALSFGEGPWSNPFCGVGDFFLDTMDEDMGLVYATFVFQLSFATTATTIVSGAMAERTNLTAYILFSFFNTVVYCIPAHWVWGSNGFLATLGAVDFAGSGVVHLVGASSALVATLMLKPRTGRYTPGKEWPDLHNPVNAIIGTFMLWQVDAGFESRFYYPDLVDGRWNRRHCKKSGSRLGAKPALHVAKHLRSASIVKRAKYDVGDLINAILGALVAITASCPVVRPYEAVIIGSVGAVCTLSWCTLMNKLKVDDPVSAVAVHGAAGMWGLIAVGLFVADDNLEDITSDRNGLFHGGGFYLLGIQVLSIVCEVVWSMVSTYFLLLLVDKTVGIRVSLEEERLGADYCEHGVDLMDIYHHQTSLLPAPSPQPGDVIHKIASPHPSGSVPATPTPPHSHTKRNLSTSRLLGSVSSLESLHEVRIYGNKMRTPRAIHSVQNGGRKPPQPSGKNIKRRIVRGHVTPETTIPVEFFIGGERGQGHDDVNLPNAILPL